MESAGRMGLDPSTVLDLTLRELSSYASGHSRGLREDRALLLWQAWQIASLSRAKKLPDIRRQLRSMVLGSAYADVETRDAIARMKAEAIKAGLPLPKRRK